MSQIDISIRKKTFPAVNKAPAKTVLENVHFSIKKKEFVCLFGPSGCGKTTILNLIAGLEKSYEGSIRLACETDSIGYVFQNPRLLPWLTVLENVALILDHLEAPEEAALSMLTTIGLQSIAETYPQRLSLGMARRVALARAFAAQPAILLMDEPFVSLDRSNARMLRALLIDIWKKQETTVLFVTHDIYEAITLADRIIFLSASPATILRNEAITIPRNQRDNKTIQQLQERFLS